MRKQYYSVFIAAAMFVSGLQTDVIGQDACPEDMQHYWKFEEQDSSAFLDYIGNLNADIPGATIKVDGAVNSAQEFTAVSQVNIPDHTSIDWGKNASFTVEFWVNKATACPSASNDKNNVIIGRDDASTQLHWWIGISCADPGKVNFTMLANNGQGKILESKTRIIDGNWHHVAIVRDGVHSTSSIFIDGSRDTTITYAYTDGFSSLVPVNVGWLNVGPKYHFTGKLDELAIHNAVVSSAEINRHYNNGDGKTYCKKVASPVIRPVEEGAGNFHVYPTIVQNHLNVYVNIMRSQPVDISVYDLSGRKLLTLLHEHLVSGEHLLQFDLSKPGFQISSNSMVIVQLRQNDRVESGRVLLDTGK